MDITIETLIQHLRSQGPIVLLESQSDTHPWSRKTYLAAQPKSLIQARGKEVSIINDGLKNKFEGNPWEELKRFRNKNNEWLFGYLGYDLKNHIEKLESRNSDLIDAPDLFFMVPELLVELDHEKKEHSVLKGSIPSGNNWPSRKARQRFMLSDIVPTISKEVYIQKIKKAQQHIFEGDFYEINLSHQLTADFTGDPWRLYTCMKDIGPVPFGAFMEMNDMSLCSQSPERFLRKEGNSVFSQPIKGTTQRGKNIGDDESLKKKLLASRKEQAENLMIVDLVRNDLSKIARHGTVDVPKLFDIESFGTVHQMVSTVKAVAEEQDPIEIIKACFPMGSMTGAPKIEAMKTIEELEDYRRGIYSGAIGYIKPNGDFDFNVVIRTAIVKDGKLYYATGGAITSDSDPKKEWEETLIKARAIAEVVQK